MADETIDAYGVFSRLAADTSDDAVETLNYVHDGAETALITMGKMVLFRAFGQVDEATLTGIVSRLHKFVANKDTEKCATVGGITYYVRPLTQEELEAIANDNRTDE